MLGVLPFDNAGRATRFPWPPHEEDALLTLPLPFDGAGPVGGALGGLLADGLLPAMWTKG